MLDYAPTTNLDRRLDSPVFPDFENWFDSLLADYRPRFVVAIARGAVRFLQLNRRHPLSEEVQVISHDALPYMPRAGLNGARVLVFDDSVIFGSTMSRVREYLEAAGAIVFCVVYAADRQHFFGEVPAGSAFDVQPSPHSRIPLRAKHRLWPQVVRNHHALLVRSILQTPLHYNLDFPTINVTIKGVTYDDCFYMANRIQEAGLFSTVADVSSSISYACRIPRFTGLLRSQSWPDLDSPMIRFRPYSKVRFTFAPEQQELRITPVLQLALSENATAAGITFTNSRIDQYWRTLTPPVEGDPFYHPALFRLLTAFVGVLFAPDIARQSVLSISSDFVVGDVTLISDDLCAVLGPQNETALRRIWEDVAARREPLPTRPSTSEAAPGEAAGSPLAQRVADCLRNHPEMMPEKDEPLTASLGKLFLVLRFVMDGSDARRTNPSADRLDAGLSFDDMRWLINQATGSAPTQQQMSLAVDFCVDRGLAVPVIIARDGWWLRVFHAGEDVDDQDVRQFKCAFYHAYAVYMQDKKAIPLTQFDAQKLCVTLAAAMEWLPLRVAPYKFGYTAMLAEDYLIHALTSGPAAPCKLSPDSPHVLIPVDRFPETSESRWPEESRERDFYDAFDFTIKAFPKMGDEGKLLISSCRTHRHAYNAIAFEAHKWSKMDDDDTFGAAIVHAAEHVSGHGDSPKQIAISLYWAIRYVSEISKKMTIFERQYAKLLGKVRSAFTRQGGAAQRWFHFLERKRLFDPSVDPAIDLCVRRLKPFAAQVSRVTNYLVGLLRESAVVPQDILEDVFRGFGISLSHKQFSWLQPLRWRDAGEQYNRAITEAALPGRGMVHSQLPVSLDLGDPGMRLLIAGDAITAVRQCFEELGAAIRQFCPRYQGTSGEFPFAPDQIHRKLEDGSIEKRIEETFLLTLDIIKGTNAEQTDGMKKAIRRVFLDFQKDGLLYQDTGDDAFIACAADPRVLWNAAMAIMLQGKQVMIDGHSFGGTRKCLYFGAVKVVTRPNGNVVIQDCRYPHTIPQAFYALSAVNQGVVAGEKNSFLAIEADVAFPRCSGALSLDAATTKEVPVSAKHFQGKCRLVELS